MPLGLSDTVYCDLHTINLTHSRSFRKPTKHTHTHIVQPCTWGSDSLWNGNAHPLHMASLAPMFSVINTHTHRETLTHETVTSIYS